MVAELPHPFAEAEAVLGSEKLVRRSPIAGQHLRSRRPIR